MKKMFALAKRNAYILCVLGMCFAALFAVFGDCIFGDWKISYSNFMYSVPPFNSLNIAVKGPYLSDVIDSILPRSYRPGVGILWNNSNIFGYREATLEFLDIKKLVYLFGLEFGQTASYILKYVIAFLGMFLYLKKIHISSSLGAFVGGITFTFSSVMVVWGGWPHTDVTAYAPFLFYFVEDIFEKYKEENKFCVNRVIFFSIVLFFMLVTGMPTYVPFFLYTGAAYVIFRMCTAFDLKKDTRFFALFLGSMAIASLIAGLMSFLYTGDTIINTKEYQQIRKENGVTSITLGFEYLRTLFAPYFREGLVHHTNEATLFSGFIFLFAVPVYVLTKKYLRNRTIIRQFRFWNLILIATLLFIFTKSSGFIYQFIPFLNSSLKIRCIVLFNFSASVLSGILCEMIVAHKSSDGLSKSLIIYMIPILSIFAMRNYLENKEVLCSIAGITIIAVCLQMMFLQEKRITPFILCFFVTINMSLFAKEYIPLIPKEVPIIPLETESVQYLQRNSINGERICGLGKWAIFPNSNVFYNLTSIAGHSLANTQSDIKEYLTIIDSSIYDTSTRTSLKNIDNQNLLRWASVKYLFDTGRAESLLSRLDTKIKECDTTRVPYAYYGIGKIVQNFIVEKEFDGISILLSTYGTQLSLNDYIHVLVVDENENICIAERICLGELKDNSFHTLQSNVILKAGKYSLIICAGSEGKFEKPLALWETEKDICGGSLIMLDEQKNGSISFVIEYTEGNRVNFNDGCSVIELSECAPRAYLANNIVLKDTDEEILNEMKTSYTANTVYLNTNYADRLISQSDYPELKVIERVDEGKTVTIKVDAAKGSILVLNDYYTDGWQVTIDGKPAECMEVNYLFRGVVLPEDGEQVVEFSYHSSLDVILIAVSITGFILLIIVIFSRKQIEKWANNLLQRRE